MAGWKSQERQIKRNPQLYADQQLRVPPACTRNAPTLPVSVFVLSENSSPQHDQQAVFADASAAAAAATAGEVAGG